MTYGKTNMLQVIEAVKNGKSGYFYIRFFYNDSVGYSQRRNYRWSCLQLAAA
jgi:hypothetical protein